MKIKHPALLIPWILSAAVIHNGYGAATINPGTGTVIQAGCTKVTCPSNTTTLPYLMQELCRTYGTQECYTANGTTYLFNPCASCEPGYTLTKVNYDECGLLGTPQFTTCKCICDNCASDEIWSAANTGYERKAIRTCSCATGTATCTTSYSYRCAVGYYGTSTNGTSGCTRCPSSGGTYGTTAAAGSTAVTSCYMPSGTTFSDTTGSGTYTGNCYYTN